MFGLGGPPKVALKLERDEALVLFELLARWIDDAPRPTPSAECFESPSEIHVLQEVMERLKADLSEPYRADYLDILAAARDRLSQDVIGETLQD